MLNARSKNHLRRRLTLAAAQECDQVLRQVKKNYPQLKGLTVAFADAPSPAQVTIGVREDGEAYYDPEKQELLLFLFNIHAQVGGQDGREYRQRIRLRMLETVGDLIGEDLVGED